MQSDMIHPSAIPAGNQPMAPAFPMEHPRMAARKSAHLSRRELRRIVADILG